MQIYLSAQIYDGNSESWCSVILWWASNAMFYCRWLWIVSDMLSRTTCRSFGTEDGFFGVSGSAMLSGHER